MESDGHPSVAIVHDYLTQRGGAERVVLALAAAFPDVPVHTTFYDALGTFPDVASLDVRTSTINRVRGLRRHHRLALPLLASAASSLHVDADVVICSSSGWAHGAQVTGRKVVYCHTPARWLYQPDRYLEGLPFVARPVLGLLSRHLRSWDARAAASAHRYLANSSAVRDRIRHLYGIDAEVVPPPVAIDIDGPEQPVEGIEPGFLPAVTRLLAYKHVGAIVDAMSTLPGERLVVVGTGPLASRLRAQAGSRVRFLGQVGDTALRWLYRSCAAVVSASFEDFGLTPIEAAAYGKPAAVLRWGGFLDSVVEEVTGVFAARPDPPAMADAVRRLRRHEWDEGVLRAHAARYAPALFTARMRAVVDEEHAASTR